MAATDYDFQSSRNEIIQRAFRIVGALPLGESLSAEQLSQGITALNDMVKSWQTKNIFLWTRRRQTISLTATTASYSVPTDPPFIAIDSAWFVNGSDLDPLEVISFRKYEDISNKTHPGEPVCVAYDQRSTVYVWPVPDANGTMNLFTVTTAKDWDTTTATGDFPAKWTEALVFNLAHRLSFEHTLELGEIENIRAMAATTFAEAKKADHGRGQNEFVRSAF
jgi:hypothetical protein